MLVFLLSYLFTTCYYDNLHLNCAGDTPCVARVIGSRHNSSRETATAVAKRDIDPDMLEKADYPLIHADLIMVLFIRLQNHNSPRSTDDNIVC